MPPIPASLLLTLSSLPNSPLPHTQNAIHTIIPQSIDITNDDKIHIIEPRRGGGGKGGGGGGSSSGGSSGSGKSGGGGAVVGGGSKLTTTQIIIIAVVGAFAVGLFYLVLHCWVKKPWRLLSKKRVEQARREQEVLDAAFKKKKPETKPDPDPEPKLVPVPVSVSEPEPEPVYTPGPTPTPAPVTHVNGNFDKGDGQNGLFTDSISTAPASTPESWASEPPHGVIPAPAPAYVGYTPAPVAREDRKETWAERWLPGWK